MELLIVPEILHLIMGEAGLAKGESRNKHQSSFQSISDPEAKTQQLLKDTMTWLLVNSCRSEGSQHTLLLQQSLSNVWRKVRARSMDREWIINAIFPKQLQCPNVAAACIRTDFPQMKCVTCCKTLFCLSDHLRLPVARRAVQSACYLLPYEQLFHLVVLDIFV